MSLNGHLHDTVYNLVDVEKDMILGILKNYNMVIHNCNYEYSYKEGSLYLACEYNVPDRDRWSCYIIVYYDKNKVITELTDNAWDGRGELEYDLESEISKVLFK